MSHVLRVAVDNVNPLWPQIEPLLAPALSLGSTHEPEDVRRALLGQAAQLWVQYGDVAEACLVTEFAAYPKGVFVRIWLAGAHPGAKMDDDLFYEPVNQWRELNGCIGFEVWGRQGWLKRFPQLRVEGLIMRSVGA